MSFSFDGDNKIIQIGDNTTSIDIQDLYNGWKEWVISANNAVYEQVFRFVGGDPLPGSKKLGTTYFIMNGWKIRPYSGNHTLLVDGNLYAEDGTSPYVTALGSYNVMIINSVSSLVDSTVQQLPEIEYASFNGGITVDPLSGIDSTAYPAGTPSTPCKTIMNAYEIDLVRGFNKVFLKGDLEIDSFPDGLIKDVSVIGIGGYRTNVVTINNTLATNVFVQNLTVSGTCKLGSDVHIHDCRIINLGNASIIVEDSKLTGGSYNDVDLKNCFIDGDIIVDDNGYFTGTGIIFEGDFTSIEMGVNSTVSLDIESGYLLLKNSTSGCLSEFNLRGGELELDTTCSGGDFYAEGYGVLYGDPIELGMNVKANHLMSLDTITNSNWNYDITTVTDSTTIAGYIKNKVLSVAKYIGLS